MSKFSGKFVNGREKANVAGGDYKMATRAGIYQCV